MNSLIADAQSSDPVVAAQGKADLRQAVIDRIRYYVGDGDSDTNDGDRAQQYEELDVVNEILREKTYYDIFGVDGIAEIYKLTKDAVDAAGADTLLMTNEYNIVNFAGDPITGASDNYANWYRRHVEDLNNAGYGEVVTGIGVQTQTNPAPDTSNVAGQNHNTDRINQVIQNLSILGLPITLTEFSVPSESFGTVTPPERAAEVYSETLRMMYGSPLVRSMLIWEEWPPNATNQTTLVDEDWNLTPAGEAFLELIDEWSTPDQQLVVGVDGTIPLDGFYGEYEVTLGGETFLVEHTKGNPELVLETEDLLAGDFNNDGLVDAADYVAWRNAVATQSRLLNDPLGLPIGLDQLQVWVNNYGQNTGGVRSTPEPAALAVVASALLLSLSNPRRDG